MGPTPTPTPTPAPGPGPTPPGHGYGVRHGQGAAAPGLEHGQGLGAALSHVGLLAILSAGSVRTAQGEVPVGVVKLFDHTVTTPASTIDTGADGIPAGYAMLWVVAVLVTNAATETDSASLYFNGDTTATDYWQNDWKLGGTSGSGEQVRQVLVFNCCGSSGYPGIFQGIIPAYDGSALNKVMLYTTGAPTDSNASRYFTGQYLQRLTPIAINQLTFSTPTYLFQAGSRALVFGFQ